MECAEIRNNFVAGRVPAGPEVDAHRKVCPHCHELFENDARLGRRLALGVLPQEPLADLFALVERDVSQEVGLRARLRAQPLRVRAATLLSVVGALFVFQFLRNRRSDFGDYSPTVFWGVAALSVFALVAGAVAVLRGPSAPLGSRGRQLAVAGLVLAVPALLAFVAPLGAGSAEAANAWGDPSSCFTYGAALAVPLVLLYWLFERRDAAPLSALVMAGGVVGVAANLLLHVHCSSAHLGHLLLGHAGIGVVWAVALRLVWRSPQPSR